MLLNFYYYTVDCGGLSHGAYFILVSFLFLVLLFGSLAFANSVRTLRQVSQDVVTNMSECESASRAVLMMVYSPCKYIASLARSILCEILKLDDKDYVEYLLNILNAALTGSKFGLPGNLEIVVSLMSLANYCSLPTYWELIIKFQGIKTVLAFTIWWLNNPVRVRRAALVSHLRDPFNERSCCVPGTEDWEGEDMLLLFSLWVLAELLHNFDDVEVRSSDSQVDLWKAKLIQELETICRNHNPHGSRWYAAYVLSYFGLYGFPSILGKRIGKSLGVRDHSDLKLVLVNEESVHVHEVILTVKCPSLLPPGAAAPKDKSLNGASTNITKAVHLSARVDQQSLLKLLEYVYSGYLQAEEGLVRKLKVFARHCKLEPLVHVLSKRNPKWGVPVPSFDLSPALGPAGQYISYVPFPHLMTICICVVIVWVLSFVSHSIEDGFFNDSLVKRTHLSVRAICLSSLLLISEFLFCCFVFTILSFPYGDRMCHAHSSLKEHFTYCTPKAWIY